MNRIGRKYEETVDGAQRQLKRLSPPTRRMVVGVVAGLVFILAALAIPIPGPFSLLLSFVGLTVLSWEFKFARTLRKKFTSKVDQVRSKISEGGKGKR